jgi:hypothetical protein
MLLLLALAAGGMANQTDATEWAGGQGDWSDPLMWRGELPSSDTVREVHLCAWQSSQIIIGPAGGRSQPTLVLCEGLLLDVAGIISIASSAPALPPLAQAPASPPPPIDPGGGSNGLEIGSALPLGVWIAIVGAGIAGCVLILVLIIWIAGICCRCRSQKLAPSPRAAKEQVQPQPQPRPEGAEEDEEWPSNSPSFKTSQRWSGHV